MSGALRPWPVQVALEERQTARASRPAAGLTLPYGGRFCWQANRLPWWWAGPRLQSRLQLFGFRAPHRNPRRHKIRAPRVVTKGREEMQVRFVKSEVMALCLAHSGRSHSVCLPLLAQWDSRVIWRGGLWRQSETQRGCASLNLSRHATTSRRWRRQQSAHEPTPSAPC